MHDLVLQGRHIEYRKMPDAKRKRETKPGNEWMRQEPEDTREGPRAFQKSIDEPAWNSENGEQGSGIHQDIVLYHVRAEEEVLSHRIKGRSDGQIETKDSGNKPVKLSPWIACTGINPLTYRPDNYKINPYDNKDSDQQGWLGMPMCPLDHGFFKTLRSKD